MSAPVSSSDIRIKARIIQLPRETQPIIMAPRVPIEDKLRVLREAHCNPLQRRVEDRWGRGGGGRWKAGGGNVCGGMYLYV
jgi:hypothetical protein